ncbi:coiled-coil domain-containing protein 69 [Discoglossus pictus]
MGCKASKMCCPAARNKKRKAKKELQKTQELSDLTEKQHESNDKLHEIQDLQHKHQEEKAALAEAHKTELEVRVQKLLEQARRDTDAEIARCLSQQAAAMKVKLDEKCAELQRSYDQEKAALTEKYDKLTTSLQETIDDLNSQLNSFKEKMKRIEESVLTQDFRRHIQDHGSPGQFWEQELQSLHFVIEMKSELLREQDKRLLNHEATMDRNVTLEERVRSLQQESEALRVQTQNQAVVTMRLSEELLSTQASLEKEIQLREQLQRDKEQHLYRTVNGDCPPQFSLPTTKEMSLIVT